MQLRDVWPWGVFLLGMAAVSAGAGHSENWVPDEQASSQRVLPNVLATRLPSLNLFQVQELAREVMAKDLHLALEATKQTGKLQGASTRNTLLPPGIMRVKKVVLANDRFFYLLEVKLTPGAGRTRITAQAKPVYRQADTPARPPAAAEAARNTAAMVFASDPAAGGPERMLIISTAGAAAGKQVPTLPDAAELGAGLVRAFMFLLDQRLVAFSARARQ